MEIFGLLAIFLLLSPIFILGKIGNSENRLTRKIEDSISEESLKRKIEECLRESEKRLEQRIDKSMNEIMQRISETVPLRPLISEVTQPEPEILKEPSISVAPVEPVIEKAPFLSIDPAEPEMEKDLYMSIHSPEPEEESIVIAAHVGTDPTKTVHRVDSAAPDNIPKYVIKLESVYKGFSLESQLDEIPKKTAVQEEPRAEWQPLAKEQSEPGIISVTMQKFLSWLLTEGHIWVSVGVLLFFVGFGLLFNYAIQTGLLTLEMRLAAATLTGIVMTLFGFLLRERRRTYALILQGGGMGVLYLAVLGAAKLIPNAGIPVLSPELAIIAMLVLSVFTVLLALLQNFQPLAIFALLGGFSAPLLIRASSIDQTTLFPIFMLLNLEILVISFIKDWRILNRMGFLITVATGVFFGYRNWTPELFSSTEQFLLTFLAVYTILSVNAGRGRFHADKTDRGPDLILALCVPFCFYFLQMKAVSHYKYGMAITCLALGLWYLVFGALLRRNGSELNADSIPQKNRRLLSQIYMLLCILFSNLVIPHIFDNNVSSAIWAVEAAFLIAIACRNGDYKMLIGGTLLHVGAMWLYSKELVHLDLNAASKLSPILISGIMFAASFWVSGFWASRFRPSTGYTLNEKWSDTIPDGAWVRGILSWTFTVIGTLSWYWTMHDQIPRLELAWLAPFSVACFTALAGSFLSLRFKWNAAKFPLALTVVSSFAWEIISIAGMFNLWSIPRYILSFFFGAIQLPGLDAWNSDSIKELVNAASYIIGVGGSLYFMRRTAATFLSKAALFASIFSGLALSARAAHYLGFLLKFAPVWSPLFSALPFLALLIYLLRAFSKNDITGDFKYPLMFSSSLFLIFEARDFFISFTREGAKALNVFVPVLNPLELYQVAILASLVLWIKIFVSDSRPFKKWAKPVQWATGALFFIWFNQLAARGTWWYWGNTPYDLWRVFFTSQCQAVVAIMWGVLGLWAILYGQKKRSRIFWFLGAGFLAADIVKLLLFDLRATATLTRIIAFLALGGLFMLIGWAAPLPPKEEE